MSYLSCLSCLFVLLVQRSDDALDSFVTAPTISRFFLAGFADLVAESLPLVIAACTRPMFFQPVFDGGHERWIERRTAVLSRLCPCSLNRSYGLIPHVCGGSGRRRYLFRVGGRLFGLVDRMSRACRERWISRLVRLSGR